MTRMLFGRSLTTKSFIVVALIGALLACALTPPYALSGLDLIAYVSGFHLFTHGGDPYASQELFAQQQEWSVRRDFVVSMWNPPIFFFYFAPVLAAPLEIVGDAARSVSVGCALFLVLLGWKLHQPNHSSLSLPLFIVCAFGLLPLWEELRIAQNTSWLSLYVASGTALLLQGKHPYLSGALLATALCKPHDFFLPLLIYSVDIIRNRQVKIVLGGGVSLLCAGLVIHLVSPGIWSNWLFRETWPYVAYGANVTTLLHLSVVAPDSALNPYVAFGSAVAGCVVWWKGVRVCRFDTHTDKVMWAWIVTPFFAPYGFLSDQVTLLFPFAYFVSRIVSEGGALGQRRFLTVSCLISLVCGALGFVPARPIPLSWLLFAPMMMAHIAITFRRSRAEPFAS